MYDAVHKFSSVPGKPTAGERELYAELQVLDGNYRVRITRAKKRHTLPQQRYYWAVVVRHVAECLKDADGRPCDKDDAHLAMKRKFLTVPVAHPETGEHIADFIRSSSSLDVREYSEFVENVIEWLWDTFRVSVPSPAHFIAA